MGHSHAHSQERQLVPTQADNRLPFPADRGQCHTARAMSNDARAFDDTARDRRRARAALAGSVERGDATAKSSRQAGWSMYPSVNVGGSSGCQRRAVLYWKRDRWEGGRGEEGGRGGGVKGINRKGRPTRVCFTSIGDNCVETGV